MCYAEMVESVLEELEEKYAQLTKENSAADLAVSEFYHHVEFGEEKFGLFNSKRRLEELKEILDKRRSIKKELAHVESMKANLKDRSKKADEARNLRLG